MNTIVLVNNNYDLKLRMYFLKYYKDHFNLSGLKNKCKDFTQPILFLLNPLRRFKLTIQKLINEEENLPFESYEEFVEKKMYNDVNLEIFLSKNKDLFSSQNSYIREKEYSKTIIVIIKDDCIENLLDYLKIESKEKKIDFSLKNNTNNIISNKVLNYVKYQYSDDYKLLDLINNKPELFKKVIN
jgi:hypothetical protein